MRNDMVSDIQLVESLMHPRAKVEMVLSGRAKAEEPCTFIEPRMIDEHLIHYNEHGRTVARIGENEVVVSPKALLWVQPGVEHEVHLPAGKATVAYLRFRFGARRCPRLRETFILCKHAQWADSLLSELHPARRRSGKVEPFRWRSILIQFICEILQHGSAPSAQAGGLQPHQQRRCLEYIHSNLANRYTIKELAGHCQLNPAYLTLQFRKSFGRTPQSYIKEARIRAAAGMLQETARTISQIAHDLGYEDIYFFSRQFRQVMGQSPRHWRTKHVQQM